MHSGQPGMLPSWLHSAAAAELAHAPVKGSSLSHQDVLHSLHERIAGTISWGCLVNVHQEAHHTHVTTLCELIQT